MAHSLYRLALIQGSLVTLIFVGTAPISVTRPALGQTILDVFDALKDTVEKSKSRQRKEKTRRLGDHRVERLQAALLRLGYYEGEADGIYGPNTDRALQAFLEERGLEPPRSVEPDALGRMIELAEAEAAKTPPSANDQQPASPEHAGTVENWITSYAETRGGCTYFDQALFQVKGPDGSRISGDEPSLFGKAKLDWVEADFALLEGAYFSACGARSGDMNFEREQFRSNTIEPLKVQFDQLRTTIAEQRERETKEREKLVADAKVVELLERKLPEIESSIAACEKDLAPLCSRTANLALAALDQLGKSVSTLTDSKDYSTRIYALESRALDIRALAYEASKSQEAKSNLTNNCGNEIASRKLSDPVFDLPIMWFQPNFTLRHYVCFFHHTNTVNNLSQYADGSVAFYIKDIRLEFEPVEVSKETGNYRYGIKKPVNEGGVLALIRIQNGLQSQPVANAEIAVRFMSELVQRYATPQ